MSILYEMVSQFEVFSYSAFIKKKKKVKIFFSILIFFFFWYSDHFDNRVGLPTLSKEESRSVCCA